MCNFLDSLERDGPGLAVPRKPKADYKFILRGDTKKSNKLFGRAIHQYLVDSCVALGDVSCPKLNDVSVITSLSTIKNYLVSGYEGLKKSNCAALAVSIHYGDWLNVAFEFHYNETQAGLRTDSWKEWLKTNVGIGDSYAQKLRTISDVFGKYTGFRKLGLSISDV